VSEPSPLDIVDGTVDVDHQTPEFLAHRHTHYAELRDRCPVAHNPRHGGFWMVTDYESVAQVARDNETFAHQYVPDLGPDAGPDGIAYQGICGIPRPAGTPRQGISEYDGTHHADLRRALNPHVMPARVAELRPRTEELCERFIDAVLAAGQCDLVADYCTPVPAIITLEMMGMPSDNWRHYADFFHATSSHRRDDPEFAAAVAHWTDMWDEIFAFAELRRTDPADDITTTLVQCEVDGRPLSDEEVGNAMWNLVAGGLDTTSSLVAWGLHHLGTHPDERDALAASPVDIPAAVEEFLRHYSPSETLTRTATRDVELGGRPVKRGDVVFISWVSANHDEAVFDDPDRIRFDRGVNKHLSFGLGGHRCIGSHLARMEAEVMLSHVLTRMPDFEVDEPRFRPNPPNILMTGVASMPVRFTPGSPLGTG